MKRLSNLSAALSALTLSSLPAAALAAARSAGCGKDPTLLTSPTTTPYTVTVNSKAREFYVRLPEGYDRDRAYRLVFTFHALGGRAAEVVAGQGGYLPWYGLPEQDPDESAVYVAAQGLVNQNDFGGLTGWANAGGEDVALVDALVELVEADLCIDSEHRYSTGFSYGGAMSYALACERSAEFRAVAVLSGGPMSGCVGGNEPIAYYGQHGISDQVLPVALGRDLRDRFVRNNGCTPRQPQEPARGSGTHVKTEYEGCTHPVTWIAFDGDHDPQPKDAGESQTFAAEETWAFFSQFTLT
ncbi:hypothetical protein DL767_004427 [Monosporascus sp. MG133]|nr:hypothetical protein DL767_004427 [Monosporascus sp. MG133]